MGGNHGDALIELGSRRFLERFQFEYVMQPEQAQLLIVNGSGSFAVELWSPGLAGLRRLAKKFTHLPLFILPSSFQVNESEFPFCFEQRTAPAYLFARDHASFARIADLEYPSEVFPYLHRDMAFELEGSDFLEDLMKSSQSSHILLIERFDREATTSAPRELHVTNSWRSILPAPLKRLLKKGLHRFRRQMSGFTSSALSRLYAEMPVYKGLPVIAEDISSPVGFTFDQFNLLIAQAAVVISNRLHAAILAAMLGKTTILLSGHPYGKLEACYESSLKDYPNVFLW